VGDIKVDIRALRDKVDGVGTQLNAKIDTAVTRLDTKIDAVATNIDAKFVGVNQSIASAKAWALTLYSALAAGMFGTMARGFGWI
jgi:putative Mn2+ efflux pump MntP